MIIRWMLVMAILIAYCGNAMADPHLTKAQCSDYPFVPLKHNVTHAQLMQELAELEAVGYEPTADDNSYPNDLNVAEGKLHDEYRRDCASPNAAQ